MIRGFVVATALACGGPAAGNEAGFPPVRIVEDTVLYPIQGDSIREIRDQLRNHGPQAAGGGYGRTRSDFEMLTELEIDESGCRLATLELSLRITTTLPDWQPGPRASDELRNQWMIAFERLVRHEDGHRQHAIEAAHELRRSLLRVLPEESCLLTQREAEDRLRNAISRLRLRGMIYDERTSNGLAEPTAPP